MKENIFPLILIDLQLFSEGGEGGADTGAEGAGVTSDAADQNQNVAEMSLDEALGKKPNHKAEETPAKTDVPVKKAETKPDRQASYEAFLKEYKDLDDARMQSVIQKRVKGLHEKLEASKKYDAVHDILAKKYGVASDDADALVKAIEADDSMLEDEAFKKGVTVEELRSDMRFERREAELERREKAIKAKEEADRTYAKWASETEELKKIYPQFNLNEELQNPEFRNLLSLAGVSMRTAYQAIHADEIIPSAMQYAAQQAEKDITDSIKANGSRPTDIGSSAAASYKSNVSELTDADIDRINDLVLRGAKITL